MITPFDVQGRLNVDEAARLARHLTQHGTQGLVIAGSTGEAATLQDDEREMLFRAVRKAVDPVVPVFVGTGTHDTAQSIRRSQMAASWGADGILLVTPYYNKPPQSGLLAHFVAVAGAVDLPVMLYNVPGRTAVTMDPGTVAAIMREQPNVFAIKEAGGNLDIMSKLCEELPPDRLVYSGDDALTLAAMAVGAVGVVSVAAHVVGDAMADMLERFAAGDLLSARAIHQKLAPVFRLLFVESNPIPLKWALNHLGAAVGAPRLPLVPAQDSDMAALAEALDHAAALSIRY